MGNPQKIQVYVEEITAYGDRVYVVRFRSERKMPNFKPGQFLHLAVDVFDPSTGFWPESRVFSIATRTSQNSVTIAYSVKGSFTSKLEKELRVGSQVWLKFPYGSFIIDEIVKSGDPAILVSGGTGLTPFISFLQNEAEIKSPRKIWFFYGVRKPSLTLFRDVIEKTCVSCLGFNLFFYSEYDEKTAPFPAKVGMLNAEEIIDAHKKLNQAPIFLAGPPVMMETFKRKFAEAGIEPEKIIIDEWG